MAERRGDCRINSIRSQRHGYRSEQRIELMKTFGCTRKVWTPVKPAAYVIPVTEDSGCVTTHRGVSCLGETPIDGVRLK